MKLNVKHYLGHFDVLDENHNKLACIHFKHGKDQCTVQQQDHTLVAQRSDEGYSITREECNVATARLSYTRDGEMFPPRIDGMEVCTLQGNYRLKPMHGKYVATSDDCEVGDVSICPLGKDKCFFADGISLDIAVAMYLFSYFAVNDNAYDG